MPLQSPNVSSESSQLTTSPNKSPRNSTGSSPTKQKNKRKRKQQRSRGEPLFQFDTAKEEYNWGRPKRRIKTVSRFDPTTKEKGSNCKIGHGFVCPQCSAINDYDTRQCYQCLLECCYEAGVGVVILQDRRISYRPSSPPEKKRAKVGKKLNTAPGTVKGKAGGQPKSKLSNAQGKTNKNKGSQSTSESDLEKNDIQSTSFRETRRTRRQEGNIFANLKEKLKENATQTANAESGQEQNGKSVEEVAQEWTESTIAASKDGAYSTASSTHPISSEDGTQSSEVPNPNEPPSPAVDMATLEEFKQQILDLQNKYDSIMPHVMKAEEELRSVTNNLEATILQRNKDAAVFSKAVASSNTKIMEIKKRFALLLSERDEYVKKVEAKGLPSTPKITPNFSTRIDSLEIKLSQMRTECDAAKERVKDLMSGTEVAKQEKAKAAHDLEEMETKHGETFTQCYKEIESFKQQLSEATAKISTMAAEKAELVEKVSSTLIYASRVRTTAETQRDRISELVEQINIRDKKIAQKDEIIKQQMAENAKLRQENAKLRQEIATVH